MRNEADTASSQTDWESHRRALHRFVGSRVADAAAAEDIVQEVLTRAVARRATLRDAGKLRQWLYGISRNVIADYYRSRRTFTAFPEDLPAPPDEPASGRELAACLPSFVERLPTKYRRAVRLSELEGHTQSDTAAMLNLSLPGAKSRVQRARGMLATMLRECCELEFDGRGALVGYEPRRNPGCCRECR